MAKINYAKLELIPGFCEALAKLAYERSYIESIDDRLWKGVSKCQAELIGENGSVYYTVDNGKVLGWREVFPEANPRQSH